MVSDEKKASYAWKVQTDVRDCPSCNTLIEKRDGCNRMESRWYHAQICRFCMEVSKAGPQCCTHMRERDNGFYREGF